MKVIALLTLGNSDLWVDGKPLARELYREEGARLVAAYQQEKGRIWFPQVEACLAYVRRQAGGLDEVHCFASDQRPPHPQDTELAARLLERRLAEAGPGEGAAFRRRTLTGLNPALYDEVYGWMARTGAPGLPPADEVEAVYLVPFSGTPALTMAVVLHGILRYRGKCRVVYLERGQEEPIPLRFAAQFLTTLRDEALGPALETRDFPEAAGLLRTLGGSPGALLVAEASAARASFDFERGHWALDQSLGEAPDGLRGRLQAARAELAGLRRAAAGAKRAGATDPTLLWELVANARLCWRQGRYVDFLGRVFRLLEAVCREHVERHLGLPTDESNSGARREFARGIAARPELAGALRAQGLDARVSLLSLLCLLRQVASGAATLLPDTVPALAAALPHLERLHALADLRNRSIMAHGWEPVSEEKLRRALDEVGMAGVDPLAELQEAVGRLYPPRPAADPFEEAAELIKRLLR